MREKRFPIPKSVKLPHSMIEAIDYIAKRHKWSFNQTVITCIGFGLRDGFKWYTFDYDKDPMVETTASPRRRGDIISWRTKRKTLHD